MARQVIEKEQKAKKEHYLKKIRGEVGDWPPFSTDYSSDLKEYVAAQDIPNFGVHVYYAMSKDPILDWDKAEHAVFPRCNLNSSLKKTGMMLCLCSCSCQEDGTSRSHQRNLFRYHRTKT